MKTLSTATRALRIYLRLQEGAMTVGELQAEFKIGRRAVYYYLRSLDDAGIHLLSERDGTNDNTRWWVL